MNRPDVQTSTLFSAETFAAGTATSAHNHDYMLQYSVQYSVADATPSAMSFTTAEITTTGDYIKKTAHGMYTGLPGYLTGTGAALPTGLATATQYFIIRRDADSFQLATSRAFALAGTAATLAKDNTISAFHPSSLSGLGIYLEASLDGSTYVPLSGTTITGTGSTMTSYAGVSYNYFRVNSTIAAGQVLVTAKARSLGDE